MENDTNTVIETTNPESGINNDDPFVRGLMRMGYDPNSEPRDLDIEADNDETEETADQQTEEAAEKPDDEDEEREYTITYKGTAQTVKRTGKQLIADIQKAMDYDNVRTERDKLKASAEGDKDALDVLDYFAEQNGMSRAEYIKFCNEKTGRGSEAAMLKRVQDEFPDLPEAAAKEIAASRMAAAEAKKAEAEAADAQAQLAELTAEYPDITDMDALPDDVKTAIAGGKTPLEAMRQHEMAENRRKLQEAQAKISALEKQISNRNSAPGRVDTNAPGKGYDPFLAGLKAGGGLY